MGKVFTSQVELDKFLNKKCSIAIQNACNRMLGKLQELIMSEFYDSYENHTYDRTYQFYKSAMTEMLSDTLGMIFMNPDAMDYPFSGRGWAWSGEQQLEAANIGSHGGWSTDESRRHKFWDAFEDWADDNAIAILREELAKVGIPTV